MNNENSADQDIIKSPIWVAGLGKEWSTEVTAISHNIAYSVLPREWATHKYWLVLQAFG